jgi:hypothetical protein
VVSGSPTKMGPCGGTTGEILDRGGAFTVGTEASTGSF